VVRTPLAGPVTWEHFRSAAAWALGVAKVEIRDAKVVLKPNFTSGEHDGSPESGIQTHAHSCGGSSTT